MRRKTGRGWIEMPQRSSLLPYRGVLSCLSKAREASGSEAARVHHAAPGRGCHVAARGARAAGRAGAAHRHALETLENYPEVTGFRAGIDLVAYVSFEPGQTKPSIISCRSLSRVNRTDSAIHLRETSG